MARFIKHVNELEALQCPKGLKIAFNLIPYLGGHAYASDIDYSSNLGGYGDSDEP